MLESQTSGSSTTSFPLSKNENVKQSSTFPEKFRDVSLLTRKIFFAGEFHRVLITSQCEFVVLKSDEIVNSMNLQSHFLSEEVKIVKAEDVDFEAIIHCDSVVYAVKINSLLFGIERRSSQLKLLKVLTKVKSVKLAVDDNIGEVSFLVVFDDNKQQLTKFLDDELEDFLRNKRSSSVFESIFECVNQKTASAQDQLNILGREIEEMKMKLHGEVPATMLQDVNFQLKLQT